MASRLGLGRSEVLTTTGRRSGTARQVPVTPIAHQGSEYIVAPYGTVGWFQNVRAEPHATLSRSRRTRVVVLTEVTGSSPEVVAAYYERERFPRRFMDLPESPGIDDFIAKSADFPVFRVDQP
jgi:deazaflavin-dependent oxidoreductase (nitroreductase family)